MNRIISRGKLLLKNLIFLKKNQYKNFTQNNFYSKGHWEALLGKF